MLWNLSVKLPKQQDVIRGCKILWQATEKVRKLSSVRRDGSFVPLSNINHTLVHLIYLARLVTYQEIVGNPVANSAALLKGGKE